jgi:hypothetical protein
MGTGNSCSALLCPFLSIVMSGTALAAGKSRETPAASVEPLSPSSIRRLTDYCQQTGAVQLVKIWLGGLIERVDKTGHLAKCQDDPPAALYFLAKPFGKPIVIVGVMK